MTHHVETLDLLNTLLLNLPGTLSGVAAVFGSLTAFLTALHMLRTGRSHH
ncbi:hypothetical protein QO012_004555 [Methylobacterium aerolatum]|uniref:Uncharacterized protein n=1 Tax=Methylobacterium aerolatum TaxID=418708 RepID=A0ABU0I5Y5_9HYPH|nr:hypothetical protein [Methylobacterium aerolatum]